ncbi:replicative DNA helicase [Parasphingorhabdus pacifica]
MALADERGVEPARNGNSANQNGGFERNPPQDLAAEQSVLGGMMLSKDAIADVVEVVQPNDFYRPAHQVIYDCVLDLYGRGEPADAITVSAELERRQELLRVGGAPYMHTLIATVPTAANASYYAEIVSEKAVLRRLVEAGTRIVQLGYHGSEGSAVEEVVDRAQAAIYDVTERRASEDYAALEELLQPTMDEIDAIASRGGESQGIPTGFADLDHVTNGLHPGQMVIVAARPGVGKALALDTPLPTPTGWTTMGEVSVGDRLFAADGTPTEVVSATEVMAGRPCYEVEFSDGTVIVADAEHQWSLADGSIETTERLAAIGGRQSVVRHRPLALPEREFAVAPYALGVWLAAGNPTDGSVRTDADLTDQLEIDGVGPVFAGEIAEWIEELGVWDDHDVPADYLRGSEAQRRALLAGMVDASGTVAEDGAVRLVISEPTSVRARELVLGLGYECTAAPSWQDDADGGFDNAVLVFDSGADEVFRRGDKNEQHKRNRSTVDRPPRAITAVRRVESVPVRCVEVDSPAHLYLAGRSMIPTHNSTLGLDFCRSASIKNNLASVIFSLEMGRTEIVMRMLSAEARIRLGDMRGGRMTDDDWTRLARRMSEISEAPLFVDDSPNLTMMEIRAKARRLKQRNDINLIVVDYMQLMTSGKKVESRQQEVSEFSRSLKLLAKELEVPVVAISQLNRGPEQRNDKKPQLSDLRESGCLTSGTRLLRADNGAEVTFGELMETGDRPWVWSLDENLKMVARPITNVFSSGVKEAFRVRLASGREVEATANHPMRTVDGWHPLGELAVGSRVAAPCTTPEPMWVKPMADPEVVLLAHLIGDGSVVVEGRADEPASPSVAEASEHFVAWLGELGLCTVPADEKFVPDAVFALPNEQIALFLRHLSIVSPGHDERPADRIAGEDEQPARSCWSTASKRLADDLARLLLRLDVPAQLRVESNPHGRDRYEVHLHTAANQFPFLAGTGLPGQRSTDVVGCGQEHGVVTGPEALSTGDVRWDEIVEITSIGEQPVFDATVDETHNFIADGIVLHNSLEQDADVVILIHRPDAFERDDPRMGEADLMLAKHRAGPTSTVTVAHQLHYSRFVDMAQE